MKHVFGVIILLALAFTVAVAPHAIFAQEDPMATVVIPEDATGKLLSIYERLIWIDVVGNNGSFDALAPFGEVEWTDERRAEWERIRAKQELVLLEVSDLFLAFYLSAEAGATAEWEYDVLGGMDVAYQATNLNVGALYAATRDPASITLDEHGLARSTVLPLLSIVRLYSRYTGADEVALGARRDSAITGAMDFSAPLWDYGMTPEERAAFQVAALLKALDLLSAMPDGLTTAELDAIAAWVAEHETDDPPPDDPPDDPPPDDPPPDDPPPTNAEGWTEFVESIDTRKVYVSSSGGSDSNTGLSESDPVKTIGRGFGLLRGGSPDWLLLKRGDEWVNPSTIDWKKSGKSSTEPMILSSYGSSTKRPLLKTSNTPVRMIGAGLGANNIAIIGIEFLAQNRTSAIYGIFRARAGENLLIEDCKYTGFATNIALSFDEGHLERLIKNVTIRRNVLLSSWATGSHSQGMFLFGIDGLLIEENLIDHCGWDESRGAKATIFNHGVYVAQECTGNVTVKNNIFTENSSHGIQMRTGGVAEDNLFVRNAIAMFAGSYSRGLSHFVKNVALEGRDIGNAPRAMGFDIAGPIGVVEDNIVAHKLEGHGDAGGYGINIMGGGHYAASKIYTIQNNTIYNWGGGIWMHDTTVYPGDAITVTNNLVQDPGPNLGGRLLWRQLNDISHFTFSQNTYHTERATGDWVTTTSGAGISLDQWFSDSGETGSTSAKVAFVDPDRNTATYNKSLGGLESYEAFLIEVRKQQRGYYRVEYTASAVNDYIRAGFVVR